MRLPKIFWQVRGFEGCLTYRAERFEGLRFASNSRGRGVLVCTSYTVQKRLSGTESAGVGFVCFAIGKRTFVSPCQPVALSGRVRVWLRVQRGHSNKCSKQVFEWVFV